MKRVKKRLELTRQTLTVLTGKRLDVVRGGSDLVWSGFEETDRCTTTTGGSQTGSVNCAL